MIDTSFLKQLDRFNLVVRKKVTSSYTGPRRSISTGRGIIFKEHRIYAPGDDIRSIDWKVYARTDDLHVRVFEEERNAVVHSIVDTSSSMNFGRPQTKFEYASMLGVGFAYLALKENEKFQFCTFADTLSIFQPKRGMGQLIAMVDHLNSIKTSGHSNLKSALTQYRKLLGGRSLIVLISDFLIPFEEISESLYRLGNNEVKVIQVLDPKERDINLEGDYRLKDSETGDKMTVHISRRLKSKYSSMLEEHIARIRELCNTLGFDFHTITTDTQVFDAFYNILKEKLNK